MARRSLSAAVLLAWCTLAVGGGAHAAGGTLSIDATADNHPISPLIYGMSNADPVLAAQVGLPVNRYGGNLADTYNWQTDTSNTGNDWFFENLPGCWNGDEGWCASPPANPATRYRAWIDSDRAAGAKTLLVLPLMGQVAKPPARYSHPFVCGFPRTYNANQDDYDPYDTNCGNGEVNGSPIAPPAQPDWVAAGASWNAGWLADIVGHFGQAGAGGVAFYGLGNEPGLWNSTHQDMHPSPETYDELWQRTQATALAVRNADPTAKILGFSEWGWLNYFCSAADDVSQGCFASSPDRAAHGGTPLVLWLLQQAKAYEVAHGVRLFDYLDLHYYPQGGSAPANLRSLYDPSYVDPSWIGEIIDLIPRMHQWVASAYPGTKLGISEWDWGHNGDWLGVLTDAEVLGIFAREQVDLAAKWDPPAAGDAAANAWRMYRNYDGAHHTFGDTWVRSTSTVGGLQVFGARRSSDGALTVIVANDSASGVTAPLAVSHQTLGPSAQVWRWQSPPGTIAHLPDQAVGGGGFTTTYPARSLTLFVFPSGSGPVPAISSFLPGSGRAGTQVTVNGTNLGGATAVTFGGRTATFSAGSATQVTATVPTNARTGPIAVTTPGGTGASATSFKVLASLTLAPTSGKKNTAFTIKGTAFHAGSTVTARWKCPSVPCSSAALLGSTTTDADGNFTLQATVPPTAPRGAVNVGVVDGSGSFARAPFTVVL